MILVFFLLLLGLVLFVIFKKIAPELGLDISFYQWWQRTFSRPKLTPIRSTPAPAKVSVKPWPVEELRKDVGAIQPARDVATLERLLHEKNEHIMDLENALNAQRHQRQEFEKVQELLQAEILRLKTLVKEQARELGAKTND